jgi:hypothetical protein
MPREAIPPEPWKSFLVSIDEIIERPIDIHCIGGFAVTMRYGLSRATSDIDILPTAPADQLSELERVAGQGSALHRKFGLYLQPVTVCRYPESYGDRLLPMWPKFRLERLRLWVLEPHDLALTKLERNFEVDREDVVALARAGHLDERTLRERYTTELRPNLVGDVAKHDLTLRLWVEMCWPKTG